jgi:hypothetical protein
MSVEALLCILGAAFASVAHLAIKLAERRAQEAYRELVGEEAASTAPDDVWKDIRPLVAGWGCLVTLLEFIRGLGIVVALAAGLYLVASH